MNEHPIPDSYWVIPGKLLAGQYPASRYYEEETRSKLGNILQAGISDFVDLTAPGELPSYQQVLKEVAGWYDQEATYHQLSITDFGVPTKSFMLEILDELDQLLENDRKVYLHCWAGIGRTGTVAACYLIRHGKSAQEALDWISMQREGIPSSIHASPESEMQYEMVRNWKPGT